MNGRNGVILMSDCLFCRIVDGELPAHTVYEDDHILAFLDINPVSKGHTLVIPKKHVARSDQLGPAETGELFATAGEIAKALVDAFAPDGYNLLQNNGAGAGQEVGHAHVHIIPRYEDDGVKFSFEHGELSEQEAETVVGEISDRL